MCPLSSEVRDVRFKEQRGDRNFEVMVAKDPELMHHELCDL